ncbi:hypothetical protein OAG24_00270 [bacterium]|nr:hypothetical protein [bacterium]
MWIYIIIIAIFIFAIFKERQALGCPTIPTGVDCDNENGKAVKGTKPYNSDSTNNLLQKIKLAGSYQDRFVKWRIFYVMSILVTIVSWFVIFKRFPSEWELVLMLIVLMLAFVGTDNFYKFHLSDCVKEHIKSSVNILESRSQQRS